MTGQEMQQQQPSRDWQDSTAHFLHGTELPVRGLMPEWEFSQSEVSELQFFASHLPGRDKERERGLADICIIAPPSQQR
jgi:hypothetical protein